MHLWFSTASRTLVLAVLVAACTSTTTPIPVTTPTPTSSLPATPPPPASSPLPMGPADTPIAAGGAHSCVLTASGGVACWGATNGSFVPLDVPGLTSEIVALALGDQHTCALTIGGGVICWGANDDGQLGDGTMSATTVPVDVSGLTSGVTAIASGANHTCAVTAAGAVKCWGLNEQSQLGVAIVTASPVPVEVSGLARGAIAVAAGGHHTCALMGGGGVKCWGANGSGQLGDGTTTTIHVPVDVTSLTSGVSRVVGGGEHSCALISAGGVKCWGAGAYGQLGNGVFVDSSVPVDVTGLASGVVAVTAGGGLTCALTTGGGVKCWGSDGLGNGSSDASPVPVDVTGLASGVTAIAAGGIHACALVGDGGPKCWGWNYFGQLGLGARCALSNELPADVATPAPSGGGATEPSPAPIQHATGPADVLLRFDVIVYRRDTSTILDDVTGRWFTPGPEFTLYGDGTVIARNDLAEPPPAEGPIVRANPFKIAHLDENEVQSLLWFAIEKGGLREACEAYAAQGDNDRFPIFTLRAGGFDRRVEVSGPSPLGPLMDRLRALGVGDGISTDVFVPDRYWGTLVDVGPLADVGAVPWPWPGIAPEDFVVPAEYTPVPEGRLILSAKEAAVMGLAANGGVVQRVYLVAPNKATVYALSMWPTLPDDPG